MILNVTSARVTRTLLTLNKLRIVPLIGAYDGEFRWVNPEFIVSMRLTDPGTTLIRLANNEEIFVNGTPDFIIEKIETRRPI